MVDMGTAQSEVMDKQWSLEAVEIGKKGLSLSIFWNYFYILII